MKRDQAVCGTECAVCEHYEHDCPGCTECHGAVFWTEYVDIEVCPVYQCCTEERHLPHCGHCPELMCEKYRRFRDPDMTEEEAEAGLVRQKAKLLRLRAEEEQEGDISDR